MFVNHKVTKNISINLLIFNYLLALITTFFIHFKTVSKNVEIFPIRNQGNITESIYVVRIPRSYNAPHMSSDKCYYKRYNFQSVKMEEYEVRDLFHRHNSARLVIDECSLDVVSSDRYEKVYQFYAKIYNDSNTTETLYKLNCYIEGKTVLVMIMQLWIKVTIPN